MFNLKQHLEAYLSNQYHQPSGLIGQFIGRKMLRQHEPENVWSISVLNVASTDQVLEIGFGAGRAISLLSERITSGHITGIDISRTMIRSACKRSALGLRSGKITLQYGNVMDIPFPDETFDKVLSIHTIYFWSDSTQALREIFRVLKPGGKAVLTLSTGKIGQAEGAGLGEYQTILEQQVIPTMKKMGFTQAYLQEGPLSRTFKTTAIVAIK